MSNSSVHYVLNSETTSIFEICEEASLKFKNNIQKKHEYLWNKMREIGYKKVVTKETRAPRIIEQMSDATLAKYYPNIQNYS